jgi:hypothetical protein
VVGSGGGVGGDGDDDAAGWLAGGPGMRDFSAGVGMWRGARAGLGWSWLMMMMMLMM